MKRLSLLFALSITVALHAQLDDSMRAAIDKLFAPYDSTDAPGAAAGIIQNGELVFAEGYGIANLETGEPATPETNFRLASVTKQFTAACVLQLVEAGELTLETTLGSLFPEFPDYADDITVERLLEHTSGLADYESLYPDTQTDQLHDADVVRLVAAVDSTLFPPGSRHQYSNSGYAVLATIVEKLSGVSFAEYLQANVFAPLGMDATVAYEKGVSEVERRAYGYSRADDGWERTDQNVTSAVLGDGGDLFVGRRSRQVGRRPLRRPRTPPLGDGRSRDAANDERGRDVRLRLWLATLDARRRRSGIPHGRLDRLSDYSLSSPLPKDDRNNPDE